MSELAGFLGEPAGEGLKHYQDNLTLGLTRRVEKLLKLARQQGRYPLLDNS